MTFLNEIAAKLQADGVGVKGSSIFLGANAIIKDGDGPYISLTETGGTAPMRTHNDATSNPSHGIATVSQKVQQPTFQLLVRASTSDVAKAKAVAAYNSLDGLFNVTLSGTFYQKITARTEPTEIGKDSLGRPMVVINFECMKMPSAG